MSKLIHKSHNVSVLLYHTICPAKYRRALFSASVDRKLKGVCQEISDRYGITSLEAGADKDHVHFLVQSVPMYSPKKLVQIIKSITAREVIRACPEVKKYLWGGEFWSDGYFIASVGQSVGQHGSEETIRNYVKGQGSPNHYQQLHSQQPTLFDAPLDK